MFEKEKLNTDDLRVLYKWYTVARLTATMLIAAAFALLWWWRLTNFDPRLILFGVLPAYALISAAWLIVRRYSIFLHGFLYIQLIIDALFVTLGVYFSGGIHSPFVFLYLPVGASAAIASTRATISAVTSSLIFYGVLVAGELTGIIPGISDSPAVLTQTDLLHIVAFFLLAFIMVFQARYYIRQIKNREMAALKISDDFLFRTIHDLRTPATIVRYQIEKLTTPENLERHPDLQKDLLTIKDGNHQVVRLIQDLVTVARTGRVEIEAKKEQLQIQGVVRQVIDEMSKLTEEKRISIAYIPLENMPPVIADRERVQEALMNLMDNAIQYNKQGGSVTITHEIHGTMLKTIVTDTGYGIAEEDLPHLFTPYTRLKSGQKTKGTGLGLYIVQRLVEKMGGAIEASSRLNEGSSFAFSLPLAKPEAHHASEK